MSSTQPLVSVIIPVYKVEQYLKACIDSVRNQTYVNLEIILIDDGSPDCCGAICDEYSRCDSRIVVIHQENSGVAKARNAGLACAKGDYLFFVDSDDIVPPFAIERLLSVAEMHQADMVCSECRVIDEDGAFLDEGSSEASFLCMGTEQALTHYTTAEWAPWNRLVHASVHKGIFFPDFKIHEDEAIKFQLLERCRKVVHLFEDTYFYRQRRMSITSSESTVDRIDMFYSRMSSLEHLQKYHETLVPVFLPLVCSAALFNLGKITMNGVQNQDNRLTQLVSFFRDNQRAILKSPSVSKAQKLRCILIVHSRWNKQKNLYVRFYDLLDKLRNKQRK